jgi:zinc protease
MRVTHAFLSLVILASSACSHRQAMSPTAPAPVAAPQPAKPPAQSAIASWRAKPPSAGPTPELEAPVPERRELANGLTVLVVPKRDLPLMSVNVVFKAGSALDPRDLPGLAGFVGDMLRSGTKTRRAQTIADQVETAGAALEVRVDDDALVVASSAMSSNFAPVFDVVADVVQNSTFLSSEIERVRKRRLAAIAEEKDDPESLADLALRAVVFGPHPYGHNVLGTEAAVGRIERKDLLSFAQQHLRPANAAVVLVGDMLSTDAFAAVEKRFGAWKGAPGAAAPPPPPKAEPPDVILVPRPDAPQSQVRLGEIGIARTSPDFFPVMVMNEILGGMFNSRINMSLREEKGYTYGAYSYFDPSRAAGLFVVGAAVRTDVTVPAIKEMLKQVDGIRARDVGEDELRQAKDGLALSLPGRFQTVGSIAAMMRNIYVYDLPLDYYRRFPERVQVVSRADVRRAAEAHLLPEQLAVVVVGDPAEVETGLGKLGRGEVTTTPAAAVGETRAVSASGG